MAMAITELHKIEIFLPCFADPTFLCACLYNLECSLVARAIASNKKSRNIQSSDFSDTKILSLSIKVLAVLELVKWICEF